MPATGFSIGVSRLANALKLTGNLGATGTRRPGRRPRHGQGPDRPHQAMVSELRAEGIRAEMFLGSTKNYRQAGRYADKRNSPAVIIEGSQEREQGILQVKDLIAGKQAAEAITDMPVEGHSPRPVRDQARRAGPGGEETAERAMSDCAPVLLRIGPSSPSPLRGGLGWGGVRSPTDGPPPSFPPLKGKGCDGAVGRRARPEGSP